MNSPSISVLVVAHNEEVLIGKCVDSILNQTLSPDEIVVVVHNCTDRTEEIVSNHSQIKLMSYGSPAGHIYARIKGFESVAGDIIVCTDGDSFVDKNWVEEMTKPFEDPRVSGVGGAVMFTNILSRRLSVYGNSRLYWLIGCIYKPARIWGFWGPSFALRKKDYLATGTQLRDQKASKEMDESSGITSGRKLRNILYLFQVFLNKDKYYILIIT